MLCPRCNSECKDNFCVKCGIMINFIDNFDISQITKETPHERDLEIFIGENDQKLIYNNFNLSSGIFTYLWFLYRKCYIFGTIIGIFQLLYYYYLIIKLNANLPLCILLNFIIFSIFGNSMYIGLIKNKVKKIGAKEDYKKLLIEKGGTNITGVLIGLFVSAIIVIIYIVK